MSATTSSRTKNRPLEVGRGVSWILLIAALFVTLFPFYWVIRTAFSTNSALYTNPGSLLPVQFSTEAIARVLGLTAGTNGLAASTSLLPSVGNSLVYATVSTVLVVFFSTTAAYAFARLEWRGRNTIFTLFLAALMVPSIFTLIPNFLLVHDTGLINTYAGLIAPTALFSAYFVFFLRQFMLGLSSELEEAAIIDGASKLRILFTMTIPLTSGPIAFLAMLGFITAWNDYFWPLLVTTDSTVRPLTVALAIFKQSSPTALPDWSGLMAATLLSVVPMLVLFIIFGRRIVNSIGFSGLK